MKKILVIEDDPTIRSTTLGILGAEGFLVIGAEDGQKGVEKAKEELPDLIICDVTMPELDGYGVLANLRADNLTATIPFIFLTGRSDQASFRQGMEQGADDYLTKPYTRDQLLTAIEVRLEKRETLAQQYRHELKQVEEKLDDLAHYDNLADLSQVCRILGATALQIYGVSNSRPVLSTPEADYPGNVAGFTQPDKVLEVFQRHEAAYYRRTDQQWVVYLPLGQKEEMLGVLVVLLPAGSGLDSAGDILDRELQFLLKVTAMQLSHNLKQSRLSKETEQLPTLKEANEWKSTLLASASHELRTPLNSIKQALYGLRDPQINLEPDEQDEYLALIEAETDRLERIITGLLSLNRIEAGLLPDKGLFYMPELVNKAIDDLAHNPRLAQHPISTNFEKNLPLIPIDYVQIEQVITNLLENAAKYSEPSSPITINVRQTTNPRAPRNGDATGQLGLLVGITDEGAGIPEDERELIFQRFYRSAHTSKTHQGIGLGLAICKSFIEAHGGQIWTQPRVDEGKKGSVFNFWLPL